MNNGYLVSSSLGSASAGLFLLRDISAHTTPCSARPMKKVILPMTDIQRPVSVLMFSPMMEAARPMIQNRDASTFSVFSIQAELLTLSGSETIYILRPVLSMLSRGTEKCIIIQTTNVSGKR